MMYNQKGFSLFELIVVVGIIAAVTGIILPVYFSMKPTIRVNGAARQIQGDLMWAKMRAVSENNNYVITFGSAGPDLSNDTYYIYDDDNGDFDDPAITDTNELVKTVVISDEYKDVGYGFVPGIDDTSGGTLNAGDDPVTFQPKSNIRWFKFNPNGRSNKNGSIYLILDEDETNGIKDRSRAITVLQTGRIKIFDYSAANDQWE